jgi:large subunit ribosomal protein L28
LTFFEKCDIIKQIVNNKVKRVKMAVCDLTGKGKQHGHNVSFSLRRTKRTFKPNIQKKTVMIDGKKVRLNLSTAAIRTLKKKGIL